MQHKIAVDPLIPGEVQGKIALVVVRVAAAVDADVAVAAVADRPGSHNAEPIREMHLEDSRLPFLQRPSVPCTVEYPQPTKSSASLAQSSFVLIAKSPA